MNWCYVQKLQTAANGKARTRFVALMHTHDRYIIQTEAKQNKSQTTKWSENILQTFDVIEMRTFNNIQLICEGPLKFSARKNQYNYNFSTGNYKILYIQLLFNSKKKSMHWRWSGLMVPKLENPNNQFEHFQHLLIFDTSSFIVKWCSKQ